MKQYNFSGTITKSVSIWVEADSEEEAYELAMEACANGDYDDGQSEEDYDVELADVEEDE